MNQKWLYLLLAAGLSTACAGNAESTDFGEGEVVVGVADLSNKVAVYKDRLEFDSDVVARLEAQGILKKLDAWVLATDKSAVEPVYFVGNRQSDALNEDGSIKDGVRNGFGYLRHALSYTKNDKGALVVVTEPATIADAVEEVKRNGFVGVRSSSLRTQSDPVSSDPADVVDWARGDFEKTIVHTFGNDGAGFTPIDLSGKVLFSKQTLLGGKAELVLTKGRIVIKPTIDAHFSIKGFHPEEARAILTTDVLGEVEFRGTAEGVFQVEKGDTIFSKSWGVTVGTVPLNLSVDVKWACGLGLSGRAVATVGATATGSLRAGAEIDSTGFHGILDRPTYSLTRNGPTVTSNVDVNGACHLTAELAIQLFDVAGPDANVDVYAKLAAHGSTTQLSGEANANLVAGVIASVGGSLQPFGVKIGEINVPAFTYEKELFNASIKFGP